MTKRTEQLIAALEENDRLRSIVAQLMGEMTDAVKGAYVATYAEHDEVTAIDIAEDFLASDVQDLAVECFNDDGDEDDAPLGSAEAAA